MNFVRKCKSTHSISKKATLLSNGVVPGFSLMCIRAEERYKFKRVAYLSKFVCMYAWYMFVTLIAIRSQSHIQSCCTPFCHWFWQCLTFWIWSSEHSSFNRTHVYMCVHTSNDVGGHYSLFLIALLLYS